MEGPKIPQIRDLPDSENLDLRNKGGGFLLSIGLIAKKLGGFVISAYFSDKLPMISELLKKISSQMISKKKSSKFLIFFRKFIFVLKKSKIS